MPGRSSSCAPRGSLLESFACGRFRAGWRRDIDDMIVVLEAFLAKGSELWIFSDVPVDEREQKLVEGGLNPSDLVNVRLVHRLGNAVIRRHLEALPMETFDSVRPWPLPPPLQVSLKPEAQAFARASPQRAWQWLWHSQPLEGFPRAGSEDAQAHAPKDSQAGPQDAPVSTGGCPLSRRGFLCAPVHVMSPLVISGVCLCCRF